MKRSDVQFWHMANVVWNLRRGESQSYPAVRKSLRYTPFAMGKLVLFIEKRDFLCKNNAH